MEDFIYIILLIAWVAFAFYRKSQKKAQAAQTADTEPDTPVDHKPMPTLEELLMGLDEPLEEKPASTPLPNVYKPAVAPVYKETAFEKEYKKRGITSIEELDKPLKSKKVSEPILLEELPETETVIFNPEDLRQNIRQAVIFSEILNRPYE